MKGRKLNALLIPVVILIWIGVLYRILGPKDGSETIALPETELPEFVDEAKGVGDTLSLTLGYADPFEVGKKVASRSAVQTPKIATPERLRPKPKKVKPKPIDWSQFRYKGIAQGEGDSQQTVLVQIQKRIHYLSEGDSVGKFHLRRIYADSIQITYRDTLRFLYLD